MENKTILLSIKPTNNYIIHIMFLIIVIITIITSYSYKTYDTLNIIGIYSCDSNCYIETSLSYKEINTLDKSNIIEYKNNKYKIEDIIYSEPYLNNNIAYQDVKIECNLKEKEKIVKAKYLYNKQRIIKKIIHKITKED